MHKITIQTQSHDQMVDVTSQISSTIPAGFTGCLHLYTPHTTAGLTVNEGADPNVKSDVLGFLNKLVPWNTDFSHAEGNSAAHIKAILVGNSQTVMVEDGKLQLGTWEKIFFCEFDGPRMRKIWLSYGIYNADGQ